MKPPHAQLPDASEAHCDVELYSSDKWWAIPINSQQSASTAASRIENHGWDGWGGTCMLHVVPMQKVDHPP